MSRFRIAILLCALTGFLLLNTGCSTVPVTGRSQLNLISAQEETQLGLASFNQIKKEVPISRDASANAMLRRVGRRVANAASPDLPGANWEFVLFDSSEANAFALPGGKVGIYEGILPITQDDAGLATVMAHEIAHVTAHHGGERVSQQMMLQYGGQMINATTLALSPQTQQLVSLAYGIGSSVGVQLPHSRGQESEADHIGLIYMARAGYDPREAVDFWKRFADYNRRSGSSGTPSFLRTHPLDEDRIRQIESWLDEAEQQYQQP